MQDMAQLLLANKADINVPNNAGYYPIHGAIHNGHLQIIKLLITHNTDINQVSLNTNVTPLYYSVGYSSQTVDLGIIDYLLNNGANANIPDNTGYYPWHFASFKGHLEVMKILISKIPVIDYKTSNADKYTALWLASQEGHLDVVKWLISNQADVNAFRESDGRTALQATMCKKTPKNLNVVQELIEHGANVNQSNYKLFTPLYYAVELEDLKIIKLLINHGANITAAADSGDQPIHMAAFLSNILIMKILFDHGASINATSNIGNTLLHEVLWEGSKADPVDKLNSVKYLLAKSVNPQTTNNEGKTAIDLAQANFQEALPWLHHPENLLPLAQFESDLIGNFAYSEL
jgi:ankyrin repeat protein